MKKMFKNIIATAVATVVTIGSTMSAFAAAPQWAQENVGHFSSSLQQEAEVNGWNEPAPRLFMAKALGEQLGIDGIDLEFATDVNDPVINELLYRGILHGMGNGKFEPDASMKRSDMIGVIAGLELTASVEVTPTMIEKMQVVFSDVKGAHWYNEGLTAALYTVSKNTDQRLIEGNKHPDGTRTADMDQELTYAQVLEFVYRVTSMTKEDLGLKELEDEDLENNIGLVRKVNVKDDPELSEKVTEELPPVTEATTEATSQTVSELPQVVEETVVNELPKVNDDRVSELPPVANGEPDTKVSELPKVSELGKVTDTSTLNVTDTSELGKVADTSTLNVTDTSELGKVSDTSELGALNDTPSELPKVVTGETPEGSENADCFELTLGAVAGPAPAQQVVVETSAVTADTAECSTITIKINNDSLEVLEGITE